MISSKTCLSPKSQVLRFMREKRKFSILKTGKEVGIKPKDLDYIEKGQRSISEDEFNLLLNYYKFSMETFNELIEVMPLNKRSVNNYFLARKII